METQQAEPPTGPPPKRDMRPRITVVQQIYHQVQGNDPTVLDGGFTRWLDSDEQPFLRKCKASEGWQKLEVGWIEQAGQLTIVNGAGKPHNFVQPSEEEKKAEGLKVLEVGIEVDGNVVPCWQVPPGENLRAMPLCELSRIMVRCRQGEVRFSVFLIPK